MNAVRKLGRPSGGRNERRRGFFLEKKEVFIYFEIVLGVFGWKLEVFMIKVLKFFSPKGFLAFFLVFQKPGGYGGRKLPRRRYNGLLIFVGEEGEWEPLAQWVTFEKLRLF